MQLTITQRFKIYENIVCLSDGFLYQLEHCPKKRTKVFRKLTYNEMGRQQIIDAYHRGYANAISIPNKEYNPEQYYNKTFNK